MRNSNLLKKKIAMTAVTTFICHMERTKLQSSFENEKFLDIIDCLPCNVFGLMSNGNICICNKTFVEASGFDMESLSQKSILELCADPQDKERFGQFIVDRLAGKDMSGFEVTVQGKNAQKIPLTLNSKISTDGHNVSVLCFATEAKNWKEGALHREYHALLDIPEIPIFGVNGLGAIDIWNRRLAAITEISKEVSSARNGLIRESVKVYPNRCAGGAGRQPGRDTMCRRSRHICGERPRQLSELPKTQTLAHLDTVRVPFKKSMRSGAAHLERRRHSVT